MSSPLITLDSLSYSTPDGRSLFDNLTLTFAAERTGLVGRNGVGKSTLARLILGELQPLAGAVTVRGRLGVLRQALIPPPGASVADLMGVADALKRLVRIEVGAGSEADFDAADWMLESRLAAGLAEVDLEGLDLARPAASLSGGQVTRASLAGLIATEPHLLILDEPTNNLDAAARDLVADVLGRWKGGAIVISHDRALLRQVDRIVELSGLGAQVFGGGYDLYAERKAEAEAADARVERVRRLAFDLPPSGLAAGKTVLAFEDVAFGYPGQPSVLRGQNLRLVGPERVAVSGRNGSGKTTLIRLAAGELEPTAGTVIRGVKAAFLDQQTALLGDDATLVAAFRRLNPASSENAARAALARFLFRNTAAEKPVGSLSGGERLRAALARVLLGDAPPGLLILDEPTNHLDLDSIAAVEAALAGYDGALLVVSHDREFLAAIGVEREICLPRGAGEGDHRP